MATSSCPSEEPECLQPCTPWAMAFTHCGIHCPQPLTPKQRSSTPYPTGPSCAASSQQQGADTAHSWPLPLTNPRPKPRDCYIALGGQQVRLACMETLLSTMFRKRGRGSPSPAGLSGRDTSLQHPDEQRLQRKLLHGYLDKECGEAAKQQSQMGCSAAHPQQLPAVPAAYLVPTFKAVPAPTPALIPEKAPKSHSITKGLYAC